MVTGLLHRLYRSKSRLPPVISISATGLAGKWQGSVVGEFLLESSGESYRQRHTVTWGQPSFLFREDGWWVVGKGKGDDGGLRARELEDGQLPPEGWQWWDREAWRVDSATITISPQAGALCQRLEVGSNRASELEQTKYLGKYKPLSGLFCRGRQVFQQEGDGKHLLSVGKYGAWNITEPKQEHAEKWMVSSVAAPAACPGHPEAGRHHGEGGSGWWCR